MKTLGIETSCDETAAAIVHNGQHVISNVVASSSEMHIKTGGIIPEVAAREQIKSIVPVIDQALDQASLKISDIDNIAVTKGPGLIGSLLVGIETAKTLCLLYKKKLIPVNHLLGHIYAAWLDPQNTPHFPLIALIVSGGHTDLVYLKDHQDLIWLGGTRDDAAGEAFDKTARLLNLDYPGGPAISKAAQRYFQLYNTNHPKLDLFPRPMLNTNDYDFSFSGLKTSVYNHLKSKPLMESDNEAISLLTANIQEAICDVLISKSLKAISEYKVNNFILTGGVAANNRLRVKMAELLPKNINLFVPEKKYCTDNAAMIAAAAFYNQEFIDPASLDANPQLTITD